MINLLPPDMKLEYYYGRRNVQLMRWLVLFGAGIIGLLFVSSVGIIYMQSATNSYKAQTLVTEARLEEEKHEDVERQVQDISSSLRLAVQVLSKEVLFSKMIQRMAVLTPSNAVLSGLTITELQGGVDITARTTDYNAATQLQVNLSDQNNMIFSKADIVSISCSSSGSTDISAQYPCSVTIRALFAKDNPFLFINEREES